MISACTDRGDLVILQLMTKCRQIFDAAWIRRATNRIAQQVLELNGGAGGLVMVGLHTHGVSIARRLAAAVKQLEGSEVPVGTMDITLYRDDVGMRPGGPHLPAPEGTDIPFDITGKTVILVDDVLNTGRSIRAALDELVDLGRPEKIQLVGLIDRGGRQLPIRPDFIGRKVTIDDDEKIVVHLGGPEGTDEVVVTGKESGA